MICHIVTKLFFFYNYKKLFQLMKQNNIEKLLSLQNK